MHKVFNFTGRSIVIETSDGTPFTFLSRGAAKVEDHVNLLDLGDLTGRTGSSDRIPLFDTRLRQVAGLPKPTPGVLLLVEAEIQKLLHYRRDLVSRTHLPDVAGSTAPAA